MQYHKISRFIAKENTVEQNGKVHFKYNGHGTKNIIKNWQKRQQSEKSGS